MTGVKPMASPELPALQTIIFSIPALFAKMVEHS